MGRYQLADGVAHAFVKAVKIVFAGSCRQQPAEILDHADEELRHTELNQGVEPVVQVIAVCEDRRDVVPECVLDFWCHGVPSSSVGCHSSSASQRSRASQSANIEKNASRAALRVRRIVVRCEQRDTVEHHGLHGVW